MTRRVPTHAVALALTAAAVVAACAGAPFSPVVSPPSPLASVAVKASTVPTSPPATLPTSGPASPEAPASATPKPKPTAKPTAKPTVKPSAEPEGPKASPTPKPAASPKAGKVVRFTSDHFLLDYPAGWLVEVREQGENKLLLRAPTSDANFSVIVDLSVGSLNTWKTQALKKIGTKISAGDYKLDGLTGYSITSNTDRAEGRRFVGQYAFVYQSRIYVVTMVYDKTSEDAADVQAAMTAALKSIKWL